MPRKDLLALTPDDLASLSTRGKLKEALRDLDAGATGVLSESTEGGVRVQWSDGRQTEIPAGATLRKGRCSCGAIDTCKHLVALVLLYQRQQATPAVATEPWGPESFSDADLAQFFRPNQLEKARETFEAGVLVQLVRGVRPVARFQMPVCHVRFLVPGDLRYTQCDCAGPSPCEHVPLAVWAFRRLDPASRAGILAAGTPVPCPSEESLEPLEQTVRTLVEEGVSGVAEHFHSRFARLVERIDQAGLIWPSQVARELHGQLECYTGHDSRFDPLRVAELIGELVLRLDLLRHPSPAIPALLVRGSDADREVKLGYADYWGLGCSVRPGRKGVELAAYLADGKSGNVLAITKQIPSGEDTPDRQSPSFAALGRYVAVKGFSFAAVGTGILQVQAGRRTPAHELLPGRTGISLLAQERYAWEELPPPLLVEEFAELEDRLRQLPPAALRPRRIAEDFHVLKVASVEDPHFDSAAHVVRALLNDGQGRKVGLVHPFTSRGRAGVEALLSRLTSKHSKLVFVSGSMSRTVTGLVVRPACLIFEEAGKRIPLQPWVEGTAGDIEPIGEIEKGESELDPLHAHLAEVQEVLGDLVVLGARRADAMAAQRLTEVANRGSAMGFDRLPRRLRVIADAIEQKAHTLRWDATPAVEGVVELTALLRLASDLN